MNRVPSGIAKTKVELGDGARKKGSLSFFVNVNVIYSPTKHQRVLGTRSKMSVAFHVELEFGSVGFCQGRKTGETAEQG